MIIKEIKDMTPEELANLIQWKIYKGILIGLIAGIIIGAIIF